jgi:hypothetical protein
LRDDHNPIAASISRPGHCGFIGFAFCRLVVARSRYPNIMIFSGYVNEKSG